MCAQKATVRSGLAASPAREPSEAAGSGTLDGHEAPTSHRPDTATAARAEIAVRDPVCT